MFPSTQLFITENMELIDKPQALTNAIEAAKKSTSRSDDRAMAGSILILGPSYSRSDKRATQLHSRYKAAVASDNGVAVGFDEFKAFYSKVSFDKDDFPGLTTEALGHVVALDKIGQFAFDLPVAKLMDVGEYQKWFGIDEWTAALLTQARMVYEDKHSTTIRFAIGCIGVSRKYLVGLGSDYEADLKVGTALSKDIEACPYVGMVSKIPSGHQVATMPRLCYIGVLYRKRLMNSEEKEAFKHYAIANVISQVSNSNQRSTCEALANILPVMDVTATASLMVALPIDEANTLMEGKDDSFVSAVLHLCNQEAHPGVWAKAYNARLANDARRKFMAEFNGHAEKLIERERTARNNRAVQCRSSKERDAIMIENGSWEQRVRDI